MSLARQFQIVGLHVSRYALVLLLLCMGGPEFKAVEPENVGRIAAAISLLGRAYESTDGRTFTDILGLVEIVLALMIAARPIFVGISAIGSLFACVLFLVLGCMLCATPGWEPNHSSPALYVARGQNCLWEVVLFGISLWTVGEALFAAKMHCPGERTADAAR